VPDHNVAKDSSWTYSQPPSQFMTFRMQNINIFKVLNLEKYNDDKVAVLEAGLKTDISGDTKATQQGINYTFQKPKTSAYGKIYFDVSKGYVIKSKTNTRVDVSYTMEGQTPKGKKTIQRNETIDNSNVLELL
jgi:hypothetical protein